MWVVSWLAAVSHSGTAGTGYGLAGAGGRAALVVGVVPRGLVRAGREWTVPPGWLRRVLGVSLVAGGGWSGCEVGGPLDGQAWGLVSGVWVVAFFVAPPYVVVGPSTTNGCAAVRGCAVA